MGCFDCHPDRVEEADVVTAYWRNYRLTSSAGRSDRLAADADHWAWEEVRAVALGETPGTDADAIALFVALADAAPDDLALCYLGAGAVEDYLTSGSEPDVNLVDETARRHPGFQTALRCALFDNHLRPADAERLRRFGPPL